MIIHEDKYYNICFKIFKYQLHACLLIFNRKSLNTIYSLKIARSDGQNMYSRVVLVCTVNVYIPASLGRPPILRYLQNCTHFTYSLRTDSYVSYRVYCKQFEINTFYRRHLFSDTLNIESKKTQPHLQSETLFISIIFRRLF